MAQVQEEKTGPLHRLRLVLLQRPALGAAASLLAGLVVGAGVCGVLWAGDAMGDGSLTHGGVEIERGNQGELEDRSPRDVDASSQSVEGASAAGRGGKNEAVVVVDVGGAVRSPGVIELKEGSRVDDALEAAGGLEDDADLTSINRAALLLDGQRVYVPRQGEPGDLASFGDDADGAGATSGAAASNRMVNINTASASELDALPGVGPSTAQAIIEDREANGPFTMIEDLMRVSGIGEKKYEKLKTSICV